MIYCLDCDQGQLDLQQNGQTKCPVCSRVFERRGEVWNFLPAGADSSAIRSTYNENYEQIAKDDLNESILNETYAEIQASKLFGYLGDLASLDVCDLGIGHGRGLRRLIDSTARSVAGVDIATTYLGRFEGSRARLFLANAEDLPFRHEFDVMVCSDILEHVLNVGDALVSVNRSLRMDGRFLVRVPFRENLLHYARKLGCPYPFVHLRSFNRQLLRDTLEQSGFRVTRFRFDGFYTDRPRSMLSRPPFNRILAAIERIYRDPNRVTSINNALGYGLMRPLEIVADAIKVKEVSRVIG